MATFCAFCVILDYQCIDIFHNNVLFVPSRIWFFLFFYSDNQNKREYVFLIKCRLCWDRLPVLDHFWRPFWKILIRLLFLEESLCKFWPCFRQGGVNVKMIRQPYLRLHWPSSHVNLISNRFSTKKIFSAPEYWDLFYIFKAFPIDIEHNFWKEFLELSWTKIKNLEYTGSYINESVDIGKLKIFEFLKDVLIKPIIVIHKGRIIVLVFRALYAVGQRA